MRTETTTEAHSTRVASDGWDNVDGAVEELVRRARAASRSMAAAAGATKAAALRAMADEVEGRAAEILRANRRDLERADGMRLSDAVVDRLRLDDARLAKVAEGLREIAALPDPVGEVSESSVRPNGLHVGRMRVPLGVVAVIYESRPNVTADAAGLCLVSGNAVILRGGKEAFRSNLAIAAAVRDAIASVGLPQNAVQLVGTTDRAAIDVLLAQERFVDLVIPRGGEGLIRAVVEKSRIPVLKHDRGVCHVYVDESADPAMAADIVVNAKVQRPGVCNAVETLLVHRRATDAALPLIVERLDAEGVEMRGCPRTVDLFRDVVTPATEDDWASEYLDLVLAVRVVDDMDDAIEHIDRWGSDHTEAIVTGDYARARRFVRDVGSSTVLVNASTRFADGGELGLGAEIGISTSRLHAYGPMGARELTTRKFVVLGDGQVR